MTRLIQLQKGNFRRVALVEEPRLHFLADCSSVYSLAQQAIASAQKLTALVREKSTDESIEYDAVYRGRSDWRILPPIDSPGEPSRCLVSGTGLTHLGSARERQEMHVAAAEMRVDETFPGETLTDSMKMFRSGVEAGRPAAGQFGIPPEWFYKGTGTILRAHGEPLDVPAFADDGGEEAEIAGIYVIDSDGRPRRLGMACGNEFSDHLFERKNYLNLAGSKLRTCALGPELVIHPEFESVSGQVSIERVGRVLWSKPIRTGEAEMCHSLRNIEHHHFKFDAHRRPGDIHVHFYGADRLSFGDDIRLADGDVMQVRFEGFGRALRNPARLAVSAPALVEVIPME
ncbi:MAG: AraD1 family protein [Candidatus Acidiferrales bacterium]